MLRFDGALKCRPPSDWGWDSVVWSVLFCFTHSKKQGDTRLLCSHVSHILHRCLHLEVQPDIALKTPIRAPWAELYVTVIKHINKDVGFKSTRHGQLVHTCDYSPFGFFYCVLVGQLEVSVTIIQLIA